MREGLRSWGGLIEVVSRRSRCPHDPRFGDLRFDPFQAAQKGFDYLTCVTF